jgi:hypothetical protein
MLRNILDSIEKLDIAAPAVEGQSISIMHPEWRGIRSSTENLFDFTLYLGDTETKEEIERFAGIVAATGIKTIVLSGFPSTYTQLVEYLHKANKSIKILCLWHGNFLQSNEEYNWESFKQVARLCEERKIYKWGFVKKGMAEILADRLGINTAFVMNYIKAPVREPKKLGKNEIKIAIWAISMNWRKNPYAMIAAASVIPGVKLYGFGQDSRVSEYVNFFKIPSDIKSSPLPQNKMMDFLRNMHVNLYVTLSECAPMTPLESLTAGSPCLMGPNSHYFEDNDFLRKRLVVQYPDVASEIQKHIEICIEEREDIIKEYIKYAPGYNEMAIQSLKNFLEIS